MSESHHKTLQVAGVTTFYMLAAVTMVMANKWVLNTSDLPLTFLCIQLFICVPLLYLLALLPPTHAFHFTVPRWTTANIAPMIPVCTANVVGLVFNTYCLQMVDASYFQVARGLQIPATVALQSLVKKELPNKGTILSCLIVSWGFTYSFLPPPFGSNHPSPVELVAEAVVLESKEYKGEAPVLGMVLGTLSAVMIAVHAILIDSALRIVKGKTLVIAYWSNVLSFLALLPVLVYMGEVPNIFKLLEGTAGSLNAFIHGSLVTGVLGFLMCVAGLLSIKVTSPVTHMYSSAVRSVLQVILGVWLFGDVISSNRVVCIFLVMSGSILYVYFKMRKPSPQKQAGASQEQHELKEDLLRADPEKGDVDDARASSSTR